MPPACRGLRRTPSPSSTSCSRRGASFPRARADARPCLLPCSPCYPGHTAASQRSIAAISAFAALCNA
eukprot:15113568-Alexandrium_andersonii.AAC.1